MLNKRNGIIALICIFIVLLLFVFLITLNKSGKEDGKFEDYSVVGDILNTEDIKDTKIGVKNSDLSIAERYDIKKASVKESRKEMYFGDLEGKVIFVRGDKENMNVFQSVYDLKDDNDEQAPLMRINDYINKFKSGFYSISNVSDNTKPAEEKLYGESKYWFKIPVEESIYVEKRLYSLSYKVNIEDDALDDDVETKDKEVIYELDFYMKDGNLVCELVRVF